MAYQPYGLVPIGGVIHWLKSFTGVPSLPAGFVECNGQVLSDVASPLNGQTIPNLNASGGGTQRFLRGSTTSGTTGGSETHTHTISVTTLSVDATVLNSNAISSVVTPSGATSTLPSYYETVIVIRTK